jgi:hypothetical protein
VTVSFTEYLLGLVIRPLSAACAATALTHIASESAKLARARFLKLMVFLTCCWFRRIGRNGPHTVSKPLYDDAASHVIKFFWSI